MVAVTVLLSVMDAEGVSERVAVEEMVWDVVALTLAVGVSERDGVAVREGDVVVDAVCELVVVSVMEAVGVILRVIVGVTVGVREEVTVRDWVGDVVPEADTVGLKDNVADALTVRVAPAESDGDAVVVPDLEDVGEFVDDLEEEPDRDPDAVTLVDPVVVALRVPMGETEEDLLVVGVRDVVAEADVVRVPVLVADTEDVVDPDFVALGDFVVDGEPLGELVVLLDLVGVEDGDADRVLLTDADPVDVLVPTPVLDPVLEADEVSEEDPEEVRLVVADGDVDTELVMVGEEEADRVTDTDAVVVPVGEDDRVDVVLPVVVPVLEFVVVGELVDVEDPVVVPVALTDADRVMVLVGVTVRDMEEDAVVVGEVEADSVESADPVDVCVPVFVRLEVVVTVDVRDVVGVREAVIDPLTVRVDDPEMVAPGVSVLVRLPPAEILEDADREEEADDCADSDGNAEGVPVLVSVLTSDTRLLAVEV